MVKYICIKFSNRGENKMSEIRNKIITISGEPVSGKSTVVNLLIEKYKSQGYRVHKISTGALFRKKVKEEYLKMYPDKTDVSLADIQEDETFSEKLKQIDAKIDGDIEQVGKDINSEERPKDVYIIDSRLAWSNVPESFAVRLTINDKIAGERVFNDKSRGSEDEYNSVEEAIQKTKQRKYAEIARYKKRYGVDLTNPENYKLIVDTSYSNSEELAEIIMNGEELYRERKHCAKYWASPVHFLPLQLGRLTGRPTDIGNTIESLAEDIRENGYHTTPDGVLEIIEKDGLKFLLEGNHRVFGALSAGRTLLPYVVTNRDNKLVEDRTVSLISSGRYMEYLYDYAEGIQYYGSKIGKLDKFKEFTINNLLSIEEIKNLMAKAQDDER